MSDTETYRKAPPGFSDDQWDKFMEDGFLIIEDAVSSDEVDHYVDMIDRAAANDPKYDSAKHFGPGNIVEKYPEFAEVIDHDRHVGFMYDVYGELLKLHISQMFIRPKDGNHNKWHPDGARAVPYGVYVPEMPMQIKIAYWLTDLPDEGMGNFVCMPGSHKGQYFDHYDTHDSVLGELILKVPKGTMTLMHCNTWHRVEPNNSDQVRKNIFLAYCPSWVCEADRHKSDPEWLATLNREQRIIMRSYDHGYWRTKPPAEDFPLFLDRETGEAADPDSDQSVALHRRKRRTHIEKRSQTAAV